MSDPFIGEIKMFAGNYAPVGYALCQGQLLTVNQNQALYAIIGTTYGGNANTNFNLPNMGGRVPVGTGPLVGDSTGTYTVNNAGQKGGVLNSQLTVANLPAHNHTATFTPSGQGAVDVSVNVGTSSGAAMVNPSAGSTVYLTSVEASTTGGDGVTINGLYASSIGSPSAKLGGVQVSGSASAGTVTVGVTGSGAAFSNVQPYLGVSFIIALEGLWPQRS